jgi:amino acid transporter
MSKRTLKRQLNLFQVIMLGTAGTLGSGIFVLTGLAAEVAGPMTFLKQRSRNLGLWDLCFNRVGC